MAQRKTRAKGKSPQAAVQETYDGLNKLKVIDLRKQATAAGIKPGKSTKATLVRLICASRNIPLPEDEQHESIPPLPSLSPSPTILSAQRKAAHKASATAATNVPDAMPSDGPAGPLPEYPANRANPLDTRRVPPAPLDTEAPPGNYMNLPPLENTPEPQAPLPADRRTLQQTVGMLAAFKRQNDELAEQVQKLNEMACKVKEEASTLRMVLHVEKTRRERAQVYILNHRSETPTLSLDDVFLPDRDVMVIQDEETGELVEEVDAIVQDTPRFAMIMEDEKNRAVFQDFYSANVRNGDVDDDDDDDMEDDEGTGDNDLEESFVADLLDPGSGGAEHPIMGDKDRNVDVGSATATAAAAALNTNPLAHPPPLPGRGLKRTASFREDSSNDDENPFNPKRPRLNQQAPHPSDVVKRAPVPHQTPKRMKRAPSMVKTRPPAKLPLPKGTAMSFNMVDGRLHPKNRPSTLGLAPPGPKPEQEAAPAEDAPPAEAAPTSTPFSAPMRTLRGLVGRIYSGATPSNPPPSSQPRGNVIGNTNATRAAVAAARPLQRQDAFYIYRRGDTTVELPLRAEDCVFGDAGARSTMGPPSTSQRQGAVFTNAGARCDTDTYMSNFQNLHSTVGDASARTAAVNARPLQREDSADSNISDRTVIGTTRAPVQREDSVASSSGAWSSAATTGRGASSSLQREESMASSSGWSTATTAGYGASATLQHYASVASSSGAWSNAATTASGHATSSDFQRLENVYSSIAARRDADIIASSTLRQDSPAASDTSTRTVLQGYAPSLPSPRRAVDAPRPLLRLDIPIPAPPTQVSNANHIGPAWAVGTLSGPPLRRHETVADRAFFHLDSDLPQPRRSGRRHGDPLYID
ncbi:hypothetical protein HYPSUDRAFT_61748 [Hypholoma sublateritium FD-334 SS-4]|uniref:Uncharacterized protein n=1 Tax=Hypholoma sublateritium (strain FD-334 SS-4) TaxID=945553 RepID=A0A0D2QB58_HYPSF|nr:hypothetical protein HYPSUDRAFT_61748 [Hypholoma sublateritium FD-334 SS-4]